MPKGKSNPPGALDDDIDLWSDRSETPTLTLPPRHSTQVSAQLPKRNSEDPLSKVNNVETAYGFLKKEGFITKEISSITIPFSVLILFQITRWAKILQTGINAICMVAYLLGSIETKVTMDSISDQVTTTITPQIEKIHKEIEKINSTVTQEDCTPTQPPDTTKKEWEQVHKSMEELSWRVGHSHKVLRAVGNAVCNTDSNVEHMTNHINKIYPDNLTKPPCANDELIKTVKASLDELKNCIPLANLMSKHDHTRTQPAPLTLAVPTSNLTCFQRETIACSEARDHQVVIKCKLASTKDLLEKDLAMMVTQALQPPSDRDRRLSFHCCSVRKTKGDLILLEMSSKDGVK